MLCKCLCVEETNLTALRKGLKEYLYSNKIFIIPESETQLEQFIRGHSTVRDCRLEFTRVIFIFLIFSLIQTGKKMREKHQ